MMRDAHEEGSHIARKGLAAACSETCRAADLRWAYATCVWCPHATSGVRDEICASLFDPHILSPWLLEQGHKSVRDTLTWVVVSSAAVCCSVMLLRDVELGRWQKQNCHAAGHGVPLPGSEGQCQTAITASPPTCDTWHTPCQMEPKGDFSL